MSAQMTAEMFVAQLTELGSQMEREKLQRYFKSREGDLFLGVRMGKVFDLAKEFAQMEPDEIEKLLENTFHEARAGAVSIMDFQARNKRTLEVRKKALFDLYLRRHDRINNWDLVDRSAPYVVGGYLLDKPRDILYQLAVSENMWERRTAIVSTYYFIRLGQIDDTFEIAGILVHDHQDLIRKATGGWLREAGKKDPQRLRAFLDQYAATMPRTMLLYAIEKLCAEDRKYYLGLKAKPV